jgi:hypothetical protein
MRKIEFDFLNTGGIQTVYAIPQTSFVRVLEDVTSGHCRLELTRTEDITEIYTVCDTVVFNEDQSREAPGSAYDVSISGVIPKSCLPNRQQQLFLEHTPLFALFMNCNDNIRLAGTEENRLTFTRKETGGTVNTRNQVEFEIRGRQTAPCCFISSVKGTFFQ